MLFTSKMGKLEASEAAMSKYDYFTNNQNINIYDASQVQPNRIFNLAVLVLPKLYSGYSNRLICLTLLRLVPSFIHVTNFPYER